MLRRTFLGTALLAGAAPLPAQVGVRAAAPLDGARTAIRTLADLLDSGYVVPDIGKRYAAMLRRRLAAGSYAGIDDLQAWG